MCTCKGTENQTKGRSYQNLICSVLSRKITQSMFRSLYFYLIPPSGLTGFDK